MLKSKILFAVAVLIVLTLILTNNTSVAFATFVGSVLHFGIIIALLFGVGSVVLYLIGKFNK